MQLYPLLVFIYIKGKNMRLSTFVLQIGKIDLKKNCYIHYQYVYQYDV